ncbi:MAG: hypothetical protein JXA54_03290 [Candidatus Heimdallarchaeota archaeon]|nr:hypothetical protein [Candidatus Heimdallarchaeota archaeon]
MLILSLQIPYLALILTTLGIIFGLLFSLNLIELRDEYYSFIKFKLRTKIIFHIINCIIGFIFSLLGIIGIILFRNYFLLVKTFYPDLQLTTSYYYLLVSFGITSIVSFYKLIRPPDKLSYKNLKQIKYIPSSSTHTEMKTSQSVENKAYTGEVFIIDGITNGMVERIRRLIGNQNEVKLTWLETITQYPLKTIEKITRQHLYLTIEDGIIINTSKSENQKSNSS